MGLRTLFESQPESYAKKKAYNFHKLVGEGTFGQVKQATWQQNDGSKREVAVKCIEKTLVKSDPSQVYDEMEVLQNLDNPHVVKILDWFESKDKYYLVFELAPGGELFERIVKRHHFSEHDAAECIQAVIVGVAYLHSKNICHRDLKPENLLLRSTDQTKLDDIIIADFGVAKHNPEGMQHTLVGSPGYAAPELVSHEGYDGKAADIWSIGVITYAMLSGTSPFKEKDPVDLIKEQCTKKIDFSKDIWEGISKEAKDFIQSCCKVEPKERPSAKELLRHPWLMHECKRSTHHIGDQVRDELTASIHDGGGSFTSRPLQYHERETDGVSAHEEMRKLKDKMSAIEI